MKVNVEKQENNTVQLSIEIEPEVAVQEYNKACRRYSERVNIPGFRKGKAPRAMIEKHVGVENIQQDVINRVLPNVLADTISENQYDLATEPIIESFDFNLGQPLKVNVKLELKPEVKLNNYKSQVVEVPEFKQAEDALDKEMSAISERFSSLKTVVGRPSNDSDIVVIDFNGTINGEPIKGGSAKNHQLDIKNSNFIKGFAEQLVGKNIGEEFTIKVTFPEDYYDNTIAGKEAEFQIKLNEIKEKDVPEVNDELAQKVGPFQTVDELKADISKYIENTAKFENKTRAEKLVVEKVVEQAEVDIPDSMINKEAKLLYQEVQERFKRQGISWEQVLDTQGHETIWNNLREEAAKRVKSSLVLGAVAKEENLQIKDEDFQAKVVEMASMYRTDDSTIYKQIAQNPALAQSISQQILGQKVVNFLYENNEIKYVEDKSENSAETVKSEV